MRTLHLYTLKYRFIHGYFVVSFPFVNETGSVYVCIRNDEARAHVAMWAGASPFRKQTYEIWKTCHKIGLSVSIRIVFTV